MLRSLRDEEVFRSAIFNVVYGKSKAPSRLVIGIGQMHPVRNGVFDRWSAGKIAVCQSWIFDAFCVLAESFEVKLFGQEGFCSDGSLSVQGRTHERVLRDLRPHATSSKAAKRFLLSSAKQWRRALRAKDRPAVERAIRCLSASNLLQAKYNDAGVFSIEQRSVHGRIAKAIDTYRLQIASAEKESAYLSANKKGGKNLTKKEYEAVVRRNAAVKKYNAMLRHPERDRSIFREVFEHAERKELTVFVLGQAHRRRMIAIAKQSAPDDAMFVWITPPCLGWRQTLLRVCIVTAASLTVIAAAVSVILFRSGQL